MQNYYQILGLANFASATEIRNAFRKLAKLYHPDINPGSQEHFKGLVKAYEVLSDPSLKSKYDYKLKYYLNQSTASSSAKVKRETKQYDFNDQELKRKQYYENLYKKPYYTPKQEPVEEKKTFNEFRNILIATPLAVLLLMILLNVWSHKPTIKVESYPEEIVIENEEVIKPSVVTGDAPYSVYFGGPSYDSTSACLMKVKNLSGYDVIVFLFHKKFIRSVFINNGFEISIEYLPKEISVFRIMSGTDFKYTNEVKKAGVYGAFSKDCKYYQSNRKVKLKTVNQLTLTDFYSEGFKESKEEDFFKP
ncbi:MAG: DnaJ domain-containing protein [Bacteroidia bacterium]|nr:DnaJ domain-containing protein [Bacteroidia bacterium]